MRLERELIKYNIIGKKIYIFDNLDITLFEWVSGGINKPGVARAVLKTPL